MARHRRAKRPRPNTTRTGAKKKKTGARSTSIGRIIAAGVRTLLGFMPGSSITQPLADFVFKSLAISPNVSIASNKLTADATCFGVGAVIEIFPVNIAASTGLGAVANATSGSFVGSRIWMSRTPYVRVSGLRVTLVPSTMQRNLSGCVAMGWIPYTTEQARDWYRNTTFIPAYREVTELPTFVTGRPSRPLTLACPLRGYAAEPRSPNDSLGRILISFIDNARTSAAELSSDDFGCELRLSGTITSEAGYPHEMNMDSFDGASTNSGICFYDTVVDALQNEAARVYKATTWRRRLVTTFDEFRTGDVEDYQIKADGATITYDPGRNAVHIVGDLDDATQARMVQIQLRALSDDSDGSLMNA